MVRHRNGHERKGGSDGSGEGERGRGREWRKCRKVVQPRVVLQSPKFQNSRRRWSSEHASERQINTALCNPMLLQPMLHSVGSHRNWCRIHVGDHSTPGGSATGVRATARAAPPSLPWRDCSEWSDDPHNIGQVVRCSTDHRGRPVKLTMYEISTLSREIVTPDFANKMIGLFLAFPYEYSYLRRPLSLKYAS